MPIGSSGLFVISIDSESDLPDNFREEFVPIMLDGVESAKEAVPEKEVAGTEVKEKRERRQRISDGKFKKLCKEVEKKHCTRESGERTFFKKLSEMSKSSEYDKTGRGYTTWESAKKRYYEVFPSKKTNN